MNKTENKVFFESENSFDPKKPYTCCFLSSDPAVL